MQDFFWLDIRSHRFAKDLCVQPLNFDYHILGKLLAPKDELEILISTVRLIL